MSGHQILVIEDEAGIREALRELLEIEGYHVHTADNGATGLRALDELQAPCLIVLDLMMPVMDGWQFLERLRERCGADARLPVAVVSAAADLDTVQRRFGCDVLPKPVDLTRLLDTAREHCVCAS